MLCHLMLAALQAAAPADRETELDRVSAHELTIGVPGHAVIRDSSRWKTLWHRFARLKGRGDSIFQAPPPDIDFNRHMVVALSLGAQTGCSNSARYFTAVRTYDDSVVVDRGRGESRREPSRGDRILITCPMQQEPVDLIRIDRSEAPVVFHRNGKRATEPGPAPWWEEPSLMELAQMESHRGFFVNALVFDPTTPDSVLVGLARRPEWLGSGWVMHRIFELPAVRADFQAIFALAEAMDGSDARQARRLLVERHGMALASDPATPPAILDLMIQELKRDYADPELPRRLLRNPAIRDDPVRLGGFIQAVQHYQDTMRAACDIYLARWPKTIVVRRDSLGRTVYRTVLCSGDSSAEDGI